MVGQNHDLDIGKRAHGAAAQLKWHRGLSSPAQSVGTTYHFVRLRCKAGPGSANIRPYLKGASSMEIGRHQRRCEPSDP